jgi:hypothetical protein
VVDETAFLLADGPGAGLLAAVADHGLGDELVLLDEADAVAAGLAVERGLEDLRPDLGDLLDEALDGQQAAEVLGADVADLDVLARREAGDAQVQARLRVDGDVDVLQLLRADLQAVARAVEQVVGQLGVAQLDLVEGDDDGLAAVRVVLGGFLHERPRVVLQEGLPLRRQDGVLDRELGHLHHQAAPGV